jgi:hypothetical protein
VLPSEAIPREFQNMVMAELTRQGFTVLDRGDSFVAWKPGSVVNTPDLGQTGTTRRLQDNRV